VEDDLAPPQMCAPLVAIAQQQPSDLRARERWADEILPFDRLGEPVWLEAPRTEKSSASTPRRKTRRARSSTRTAWAFIRLRPDRRAAHAPCRRGHTTLRSRCPCLSGRRRRPRYPVLFWEADARFAAAMTYLKRKRYGKIGKLEPLIDANSPFEMESEIHPESGTSGFAPT